MGDADRGFDVQCYGRVEKLYIINPVTSYLVVFGAAVSIRLLRLVGQLLTAQHQSPSVNILRPSQGSFLLNCSSC
jgi:hypothetical protein